MNTQSAPLLCGALLASVMGATEGAQAQPTDIPLVTSINGDFSVQSAVHTFLGAPTTYGLSAYPLTVSSALSVRPGFDYEMTWDVSLFSLAYFASSDEFWVDLDLASDIDAIDGLDVKGSDGTSLAFTDLTGNGTGFTDFAISLSVNVGDLTAQGPPADQGFTIQWSTVPAPGALALLGIGGLFGSRRRRRS